MPDPCEIRIEGVQAGPPYGAGGSPLQATVVARVSEGCDAVRLVVRVAGPGTPPLVDATVAADFSNADSGSEVLPGLVSHSFPVPDVGLRCGDTVQVEATCASDPSCSDSAAVPIECKPAPGGGPGDDGSDGGWWPPTRCMFTAAGSAMGLLAASASFAIGVGTQNAALVAAALAIAGIAGLSWALWTYWCAPSICTRLGVLCWVFKRAFIAAIPVLAFSTDTMIILVLIGYGAIAGILVIRLRDLDCPVPSARQPLTQIPI